MIPRRARWLLTGVFLIMVVLACCPVVSAGGGHGENAAISETVDTAGKTGIGLYLANLYNNDRLMYALLVTATMAVLGMIVAQVADIVLRVIGAQRK